MDKEKTQIPVTTTATKTFLFSYAENDVPKAENVHTFQYQTAISLQRDHSLYKYLASLFFVDTFLSNINGNSFWPGIFLISPIALLLLFPKHHFW